MSTSTLMRRLHRGLSVAFTLAVLANLGVMPLGNEELGMVVGGLTLVPLLALMLTGAYLFVLPRRARRRAAAGD